MSAFDEFKAALPEFEAAMPQVVVWNTLPVPVLAGRALRKKGLQSGGFQMDCDFRFDTRTDAWPAPGPQLKQQLTYLGDAYRIDSITRMPGETYLRFECNDPSQ